MFFDSASEITQIASRCGTAVFVVPRDIPVKVKNALVLEPDGKGIFLPAWC